MPIALDRECGLFFRDSSEESPESLYDRAFAPAPVAPVEPSSA